MKIVAKKITLKKDTLNDIRDNNIDTVQYVERIKGYLEKANYLITNKMIDMNSIEFYKALNEVFDIHFDPNDYLKILSLMNNKHYNRFLNVNTNMYDENDYNVSYFGVATKKVDVLDEDTISVQKLRKYTDSSDLLLLRPDYKKNVNIETNKEKFESHLFNYINVNNEIIDENNPLFPYAAVLAKKTLLVKHVLFELKQYVDEVKHQVRAINGLALVKDDEVVANIGKLYKRAYDRATNDRVIPKKEKISVRYHDKYKYKGKKK